jgi:hypothetical protein
MSDGKMETAKDAKDAKKKRSGRGEVWKKPFALFAFFAFNNLKIPHKWSYIFFNAE